MGLAVQDQRIDREADIIDARPAHQPHLAGLGIDLDLADMRAGGKRADRHGFIADAVELAAAVPPADRCASPPPSPRRRCRCGGRFPSRQRRRARIRRRRGSLPSRCAAIARPFSMIASEAVPTARLAIRIERAECEPPPATTRSVSCATKSTLSNGTPSHSVSKLREAGLVALTAVHRAEHQLDPALGRDGDLGALARKAAGGFDVVGEADAAQHAARAGFGLARREALPIGERQGRIHARSRTRRCRR